ncbi:hypothetical protein JKA74_20405 [Marivirga sp. S37H4]|uniref:DUF4199 domain-containing protein n=1 Tax=Marivirga aurantiaca TaxID=2802615 RepID=A0A935CBY6_9BACT|nr:hypothetical protein [Marivirga aurantiaca]MBK6267415.1 hypothetical protein [Marivirga aurantiaca]
MKTESFKNLAIICFIISAISILINFLLVNNFYQSGGGFSDLEVSLTSILLGIILFVIIMIVNLSLLKPYVLNHNQSYFSKNKFKLTLLSTLFTLLFCLIVAVIFNYVDNTLSYAYSTSLNSMFASGNMDEITLETFSRMPLFLQNIFMNFIAIVIAQFISVNLAFKFFLKRN